MGDIARDTIEQGIANMTEQEWDSIMEAHERNKKMKKAYEGKQYYLDNCGDGIWYCQNCDQEECGKRMANRVINGIEYII